MTRKNVFVAGGTGYIGRELIPMLLERGHQVRALVRPGSEQKLPAGCEAVIGDAMDGPSFADRVQPSDTFIQLVGVPHPSPAKAAQFRAIDLTSVGASVSAAARSGVRHFIYVSVAQPAPVMKVYQAVRAEGEQIIRHSGMNATILRPWYVLGPGHRWAYALLPMYRLFELIPGTRDAALRLGLVTLEEMVAALAQAVESPGDGISVYDVPSIRQLARAPHAVAAPAVESTAKRNQ